MSKWTRVLTFTAAAAMVATTALAQTDRGGGNMTAPEKDKQGAPGTSSNDGAKPGVEANPSASPSTSPSPSVSPSPSPSPDTGSTPSTGTTPSSGPSDSSEKKDDGSATEKK